MNILIAADYGTPASGNFVASCVELGRILKIGGSTLTFIIKENNNTRSETSWVHWLEREGHRVYLTKYPLQQEEALVFLKQVITAHKIDILHIHFGMFHRLAVSNSKSLGVKVVVHDHMDFPAGANLRKEILRCLAYSLVYRINGVAVVSVNPNKNQAYALAKHWYVPNGLSMIRNVPESISREQMRLELGLVPEDKICLFLGWDLRRKGLDIAVTAIAKLREENPHMLLAVVGVGIPPSQNCLEFLSGTTNVDPHSPWIRYWPSREDMFAYHRAADVYLSASRSEAFSYGILEAISQNTPVVASDIKGTSWCHSYDKAVIYPTENPSACAQAIRQSLKLGQSQSNADKIVCDYSIEKWCNQMLDVYRKMLK